MFESTPSPWDIPSADYVPLVYDTADSPADSPETELEKSPPQNPPRNVLVLEDDPLQLDLLTQHLESLGVRTHKSSTIEKARKTLREHPIDLGVFDVHVPDGSGLELCAQIDDDLELAGLPVIILSSSTDETIIRKTRSSGGSFFLSKPYDPNVLITIVERALGEAY